MWVLQSISKPNTVTRKMIQRDLLCLIEEWKADFMFLKVIDGFATLTENLINS